MKTYALLLLAVSTLAIASCGPLNGKSCEGDTLIEYDFNVPISIYPTVDTIHIGDTLWIESAYDKNLNNSHNGKTYDVSGIDMTIKMGFENLLTNPTASIYNPVIIDRIGHTTAIGVSGGTLTGMSYIPDNDKMRIKYGWVPSNSGPYMLEFSDDLNYQRLKLTGQHITKCPDEYLYLSYSTNNKAENGYHLYRASPDTNFNIMSKDKYDKGGCYSVYVK